MPALVLAALVGVVHVHHAPSHDSDAPFEAVVEAGIAAGLDFVVLTEHADSSGGGPLPAAGRAGIHSGPGGRRLLVLVGVELSTRDGHLLALDVPQVVPSLDRPAREVIEAVHALGGFAVVPHPFSHGGWRDWDAPFDGLEVHNNASDFRRIPGLVLPFRILRLALDRRGALAAMLVRPARELERWDALLASGRRVVGFSGADAHRNVSLLGWQLDPYAQQFGSVQTVCPDGPLEPAAVWAALREGRCAIRYALYSDRAGEARRVEFPSGRVELQLDGGERVLEISQPPRPGPP